MLIKIKARQMPAKHRTVGGRGQASISVPPSCFTQYRTRCRGSWDRVSVSGAPYEGEATVVKYFVTELFCKASHRFITEHFDTWGNSELENICAKNAIIMS